MSHRISTTGSLVALVAAAALWSGGASAQSLLAFAAPPQAYSAPQYAPLPQTEPQTNLDEDAQLDPRLQRQIVNYASNEPAGTIVVDTPHTYLYLVLGDGKAMRYGIGVGREGFTWSGVKHVARKAEWPDWYPPAEMIARQPYLPRVTLGGPGNPLGARALYIGGTEYRIHGTNDPSTIGKNVSSGCIRLTNEDIKDLYQRVPVGAKVVVLPQAATRQARMPAPNPQANDWRARAQAAIATAGDARAAADEPNPRMSWNGLRQSGLY
jgi:lipoprotein-anchoring transpeptidase ErfK/SrfK